MSLSSGLLGMISGNSTRGVKIPTFSGFKFSKKTIYSGNEMIDSLTESADNILNAAKLIKCLYLMYKDSDIATNAIGMIMANAMGVAMQVASRIISAFSNQINRFTSGIGTRISGLLRNSFKLIVGLLNMGYQIWQFVKGIYELTLDFSSWLGDVKDCEYMFAMIARCYLNKTLGNKITSIQNNIIKKINKYGNEINDKLREELEDVDVVNNFLSKEVTLINKANKQLSNYNNEIRSLEASPPKTTSAIKKTTADSKTQQNTVE